MKKNLFIISFILFNLFNSCYSQDWIKYSDSILDNLRKSKDNKAIEFLALAERDLANTKFKKDTTYADFLYHKGLVQFIQGENPESSFNESLSIWNESNRINQKKLLYLTYFLGRYFDVKAKNYEKAYDYYKSSYEIGKSNSLESNQNFKYAIYCLSLIDYYENKNYNKAKQWARLYIELNEIIAFEEYDFNYIKAFYFANDHVKAIEALQKYLELYNKRNIESPSILYNIYIEFLNAYSSNNNYVEAIKYGEKALELSNNANLNLEDNSEYIYTILISAYNQIKDNINERKYEKLKNLHFPNTYDIDYYDELNKLVIAENISEFETKFNDYSSILISQNNYDDLLAVYTISITLFERSILFSKEDIKKQIEFLQDNEASLNAENKIFLNILIAEFSIFTKDFITALKISNNNLDVEDISLKLGFYRFKTISETYLGLPTAKETSYRSISIAENSFGELNPQTLPNLISSLQINMMGTDNQSVKTATKALKIIYDNQLENTEIASQLYLAMATEALMKNNLYDAIEYSKNVIDISEKLGKEMNPMTFYSSLLVNGNAYLLQGNYEASWQLYERAKLIIEGQSNIIDIAFADYYYSLGHFYFWQDKFHEAKENYEMALDIYGISMSKGRDLNLILSDYFLTKNVDTTIKKLGIYYKNNGDISSVLKIIYLLKFNTNKSDEAKDILLSSLNKIIKDNNEYFHLLSDYEREILYIEFTDQFEFLSSHLLSTEDESFLEKYINYRFYFKSLLFYNSSTDFVQNEESRSYLNQFKVNNILINKYYEQRDGNNYLNEINELKQKNRELEKFLSQSKEMGDDLTIDQIKNELTDKTAYVEIIRINKQSRSATKDKLNILNKFTDSIYYGAIILKKDKDPKFILISESNKLEESNLENYNSYLNGSNKFITDKNNYPLFFGPLEVELTGIESIYLVTDGIYNSINVESFYNPSKDKYVIEYLDVNRVISARSLVNEQSHKNNNELTAVLIGNPEFELAQPRNPINNQVVLRDYEVVYLRDNVDNKLLSYLPGTEKEINSIESILKKARFKVNLFSSEKATESNLKTINSPKILHLATHGYFLRIQKEDNLKKTLMGLQSSYVQSNVYLKSGILLAGAQNTLNGDNSSIESDNGIFTAEEAKRLDLRNTELVVLSACETGLGDNLVGEGVYGLQRAFMIAGAKSVIMSLWKVDDNTTQKLMQFFYTNWIEKGMQKAAAFKEAKMELKKDYPEPFYWAPFILIE